MFQTRDLEPFCSPMCDHRERATAIKGDWVMYHARISHCMTLLSSDAVLV